jgi:hypothetical protein
MAKARITLLHATSHESRHGKFPRKGSFIDTTDAGKIAYYTRQSEFSVSPMAEPKPAKVAKVVADVAKVVADAPEVPAKPEPQAPERRPWNAKMAKPDLLAEAKRRRLAVADEDTVKDIIELLTADDEAQDDED